ncbi:MAG: thermonuclease family protein [bacterium]
MNALVKVYATFLCGVLWLPVMVYSEPNQVTLRLQSQGSPAIQVGQVFIGKVIDVASGETLTLLTPETRQIEVWLAEIEAPEKGQIYWDASRQILAGKVLGNEVTIQVVSIKDMEDGYDYVIAEVYVGSRWVNREMVAEGWAWHYPQYFQSQALALAEQQAREKKLGVWAVVTSERPWEYQNPTPALPEENKIQPLLKMTW